MNVSEQFQPDWSSAPGETIGDILHDRSISDTGFANLMNISLEDAADLLEGRSTVTLGIARRLTRSLGASVEYWMSRDYQYRQDSRKFHRAEEEWLRNVPLGDMIKFGWLRPRPLPSEELAACLTFFGVSSVLEWNHIYSSLQDMAVFRSSPSFDSRHESTSAWLRQGEREAERIECGPWNSRGFWHSLARLRSLTRQKDPDRFIPVLQETCAVNGVAVVVVRAPSGCRASGAVRFAENDKAILQLSFRYLTDDHFWFTFFHEAGHLVLHAQRHFFSSTLEGQRPWILEGAEIPSSQEELEANDFAALTLVPLKFKSELLNVARSHKAVIRLAHRIGVSPGVVVGQLQKSGRIGYDELNRLKRRFVWKD